MFWLRKELPIILNSGYNTLIYICIIPHALPRATLLRPRQPHPGMCPSSWVRTMSYSESAYLITLIEPLKPRLWDNSEICLLFGRKGQHIYISHVLDSIIFAINVPYYPSRIVGSNSLRSFEISVYTFHINNDKFSYSGTGVAAKNIPGCNLG